MIQEFDVYLDKLETAKGNRRAALNNYNAMRAAYSDAFTPLFGPPTSERLKILLDICKEHPADNFALSSVFVCASLFCYNPDALYDGKIKIRLAKMIAQALGVTHSSVYIARKKVVMWLRIYPAFYNSVRRSFEEFQTKIS